MAMSQSRTAEQCSSKWVWARALSRIGVGIVGGKVNDPTAVLRRLAVLLSRKARHYHSWARSNLPPTSISVFCVYWKTEKFALRFHLTL